MLVSGGGWGVGDLATAVETALALDDVGEVVCLCGRNAELRGRLEREFGDESRVRVEGFTDLMGDWLAAGDALVHSTGGLTVLEAHMRGCPTVSYGWGRGHIRANNHAFARYGIAEVAASQLEPRGRARARSPPVARRTSPSPPSPRPPRSCSHARSRSDAKGPPLRTARIGPWAAPAPAAYGACWSPARFGFRSARPARTASRSRSMTARTRRERRPSSTCSSRRGPRRRSS